MRYGPDQVHDLHMRRLVIRNLVLSTAKALADAVKAGQAAEELAKDLDAVLQIEATVSQEFEDANG